MNSHRHSRCHYKRNFGSTPAGTNNPPRWRACGATKPQAAHRRPKRRSDNNLRSRWPNSSSDGLRTDAAATRPRPTRHVTGAPVTTCEKLHRHLRQYRASSTVEPVPRLEATLRTAQQCQPSTLVTGQSAAGEGATVDTARNGPAVMAVAGGRKQRSSRQQAHVPSWDSERTLSHGVKTTRPCSVPRTARARTTVAPQATRPVALTLRQDRRHLWQAKQATLHLRHNDRIKRCATSFDFVSFSTSSFSLLPQGSGKRILRKGSFSTKETGPEPPY
jgi:hypothetical protein